MNVRRVRLWNVAPRTRNALVLLFVATAALAIYDWQRARAPQSAWLTDEAVVFERARTEGKRVFVVFTASWSAPSQELEQTFADPDVSAAIAKDFVALKIDVTDETEATRSLQRRFGVTSLPAVRMMTRDGTVVGSIDTRVDPRTALNIIRDVASGERIRR